MTSHGPSPETRCPLPGIDRMVFLKAVVRNPAIIVGDYTYYDDPDDPAGFERNVLYHFDFIGDRLIIGRFCQIAAGVQFVMNGGNHRMAGFSTFPFAVFGQGWSGHLPDELSSPYKGDMVIGNDVWLGHDCLLMPGVTVGDGAIVATRAVVVDDVPAYAVVAGNPARVVRMRFDPATIARLLEIRWWDWSPEKITRNIAAISGADIEALAAAE
jgi:virginiamycin A acetyltransferase